MKAVCGLFVFLALLVVASSATQLPQDLLKSHYDGRSGDILLYNKQSNPVLGSVSFVNAQKFPATTTSIPETAVADIITHINGLAPFQPNRDRSSFPPTSFFSKPKANLFFYIQNPSSFPLSPLSNSQSFPLARESFYSASSSLSQLTTLFSGVSPSTHGIISDSFVDRIHNYPTSSISRAFDSWSQGVSFSANLADLWTLNFQGQSLILSFSASKQVSSALNAKPLVLENTVSPNFGFYLSNKDNSLHSIYNNKRNQLLINKNNLLTLFNNVAPCGLNFEDKVDFEFIAEIGVPKLLMKELEGEGTEYEKYVKDSVPDMYAFGYSGLKGVGEKYGKESEEMRCAVEEVGKSVKEVNEKMREMYGEEKVLTEVVSVEVDGKAMEKEQVGNVVKGALKAFVESNRTVSELLPNVYLTEVLRADKVKALTERLNKALEGKGVEAVQMPEAKFESHYQAYDLVRDRRAETGNNSITNAGILHTCLWTGIFLGVSIVGGAYFMFGVDASSDPILYQHDINHPTSKQF